MEKHTAVIAVCLTAVILEWYNTNVEMTYAVLAESVVPEVTSFVSRSLNPLRDLLRFELS